MVYNATKDRKYGGSTKVMATKEFKGGNRTDKGAGMHFNSLSQAGGKAGGKKATVRIKGQEYGKGMKDK